MVRGYKLQAPYIASEEYHAALPMVDYLIFHTKHAQHGKQSAGKLFRDSPAWIICDAVLIESTNIHAGKQEEAQNLGYINDELKLVNFVQTSAHTEIGGYYFASSTTTFFGDDTLY